MPTSKSNKPKVKSAKSKRVAERESDLLFNLREQMEAEEREEAEKAKKQKAPVSKGKGYLGDWEDAQDKESGCHTAEANLSPEEAIKQLSARISKISDGIAQGTIPGAKMPVATATLQQLIQQMSALSQQGKPTVANVRVKNQDLQKRLAIVAKVMLRVRNAS